MSGGAILEDGDGIELVQKFDTRTTEWTEVAGMLIPRSGSAACFLGGYIYVIGKTTKFRLETPSSQKPTSCQKEHECCIKAESLLKEKSKCLPSWRRTKENLL